MEKKKERNMAITRIVVAVLFVFNMVLVNFGWTPLELDEESVYQIVSAVALGGSVVWAWWKNNNVTDESIVAQSELDKLKEEKRKRKEGIK